jgi:hypothetical protein
MTAAMIDTDANDQSSLLSHFLLMKKNNREADEATRGSSDGMDFSLMEILWEE